MDRLSLALLTCLALAACFQPGNDVSDDTEAGSGTSGGGGSTGEMTTGEMTTGETTTGADSSGDETEPDSSGDGPPEPMCNGANQVCLEAAPNGWAGPTIVYQTDPADVPDCPSAAPDISVELNIGLSAAPAVCGCDCAEPLDPDCADATLQTHCGTFCDAPEGTTNLVVDVCEPLSQEPGGTSHSVNAGLGPTSFDGSCAAVPSVELSEVSWTETVRACTGQPMPAADCQLDEVCIVQPALAPPFRVCIHRSGEQSCPLEGYTDRFEAYAGVTDERDCEACTCGEIVDGLCTRSVEFYTSDDCSGDAADVQPDGGGFVCSQVAGTNSARLLGEISGECPPNAPAPVGEAFPADAETFCCLP